MAIQLLHTAVWDREFREEAWKDKTVCIIGSGASAVQVVPQMQVCSSLLSLDIDSLTIMVASCSKDDGVFSYSGVVCSWAGG